MDPDTATLAQLTNEFVKAINESARVAFFVRDAKLQAKQIEILLALKKRIKTFKYGAIDAGDEAGTNKLFQFQCRLNAEVSFLRMWTDLKKSKPYVAWDDIIDAQEYVSIAIRAANDDIGLDGFMNHLKSAETVLFPGYARYNSVSAFIRGGTCSVCRKPFGECQHVEGLVYWGRLCVRIHPEIVAVDHVALVEEPRDRRCVITEVETKDGYCRDYMTWRITEKAEKHTNCVARFKSILFSNKLLEID